MGVAKDDWDVRTMLANLCQHRWRPVQPYHPPTLAGEPGREVAGATADLKRSPSRREAF
jgi:hypothetical protein